MVLFKGTVTCIGCVDSQNNENIVHSNAFIGLVYNFIRDTDFIILLCLILSKKEYDFFI